MHLLYADESGDPTDSNQQFFILAGISIFERQGFWFANELDKIASRFDPAEPSSVELHGNPMLKGNGRWRKVKKEDREQALFDTLDLLAHSHTTNRLFTSVVRKTAVSPQDPVEYAFEQMASRFDQYLMRLHRRGDTQRGIIIFDKTKYEKTLQTLSTDFRTIGHSWGILRNFAEVPLFLDSRASRLIQLADLVAYSTFLKFERGDDRFFSRIENRFDSEGGIRHGLHVRER
jgi:hypothetical protein